MGSFELSASEYNRRLLTNHVRVLEEAQRSSMLPPTLQDQLKLYQERLANWDVEPATATEGATPLS